MPGSSMLRRGPAAAAPSPQVSVFPSPQELGSALAQLVAQREAQSGPGGGRFSLGVSGGSLVRILAQELPAAAVSPARWLLAFVDERRVPLDDPESNYGAYKVGWWGGVDRGGNGIVPGVVELPIGASMEITHACMHALHTTDASKHGLERSKSPHLLWPSWPRTCS